MNDLYDIITALRLKHGLSLRQLAIEARIPPTTLASMMSRRPATIDKDILIRLAIVFGVRWVELLNKTDTFAVKQELNGRVSVEMSQEDIQAVRKKLIDPLGVDIRPRDDIVIQTLRYAPIPPATTEEEAFRHSFNFIISRLNDAGLMEAMKRVLDIASDPKYCKMNKEAEKCQKDELPMAMEPSENAPTDAGKPSPLSDAIPEQES